MDPLPRNLIVLALTLSLALLVLGGNWQGEMQEAPGSDEVARALFEDNGAALLFLGLLLATGLIGGVYLAKSDPEVEA